MTTIPIEPEPVDPEPVDPEPGDPDGDDDETARVPMHAGAVPALHRPVPERPPYDVDAER